MNFSLGKNYTVTPNSSELSVRKINKTKEFSFAEPNQISMNDI